MDLDAEMAKLQEEARRNLAARKTEEPDEELPRQHFDPELLKKMKALELDTDEETSTKKKESRFSITTKLIMAAVALIFIVLSWDSLIVPAIQIVITGAVIVLAMLGVWKVIELRQKKPDPDA